jgi:hypothetical protein
MSNAHPKQADTKPTLDLAGMPEFAKAIRGLANVPKKEVDAAIARDKAAKKRKRP